MHHTNSLFKLVAILVILLSIGTNAKGSATTYSQANLITLNLRSTSTRDVLKAIEKQSEYIFFYNDNALDLSKKVSISVKDKKINDVLDELFTGTSTKYKIENRQIVLYKGDRPKSTGRAEQYTAPDKIIGKVVDSKGEPLVGVSVYVKGTSNGNTSDLNGYYSIEAPVGSTLVFSSIGFVEQEYVVRSTTEPINIKLADDAQTLDEIVVVGYGTQKKKSLVGSQSVVKPTELKVPVRSLSSAVGGRLAGIVSVQRSGAPGSDDADLMIRGISTFATSPQTPLIVIDGVPGRGMNNIDPEDVESFTVLKDASATAVYGTRGANGVLLIETKKGKEGAPLINLELNSAITRFTQLPKFVDAPTYMSLYDEGLRARGRHETFGEEIIQKHASGEDPELYPNVDWFKELFKTVGNNQRANLNIQGGAKFVKYYIAMGYFGEDGLFRKSDIKTYNSSLRYTRYNFLSNVNIDVTPTTRLQLGLSAIIDNQNYGGNNISKIFDAAVKTPPHLIPPMYSNGQVPQVIGGGGASVSPYAMMTRYGYTSQDNITVRSNFNISQDLKAILKGLTARLMFSYDSYNFNKITRVLVPQTYYASGRDIDGNLLTDIITPSDENFGFSTLKGSNRNVYFETSLNYSNTFGRHDFSGMLLFNQSDYVDGSATNVVSAIPYRQRGVTGRATYGYDNRYFVEGNFGYSGSENFTPDRRYGFFPSVGAGWIISNEKFFKGALPVISHLKLRYTYGLTGNSDTGSRFLYMTTISGNSGYTFGTPTSPSTNNAGLAEGLAGGNVTWETARKHNLGLEINLFKNELQFIIELFKENRDGILLKDETIPNLSGMTTSNWPYVNIGKTENKGIDLTVVYNKQFNSDFFTTLRGTFTYNRNLNIFDGRPPRKYPWLERHGQRISQRYGYISEGFFTSEEEVANSAVQAGDTRPGDLKYRDMNADGIIDSYDTAPIGYGDVPALFYGLNVGVGYKGFDLNLFFQGAGLVDFMYTSGYATEPFKGGANVGNLYTTVLDRWTEDNPNPNAFYPRLSTAEDVTSNYDASSHWVKRSDYLRLKNAEFGYNFHSRKLERVHIKKLRVYLSGTNLLTFSKWKIWDPELGNGNGTGYPNTTSYNLGVRVSFQ